MLKYNKNLCIFSIMFYVFNRVYVIIFHFLFLSFCSGWRITPYTTDAYVRICIILVPDPTRPAEKLHNWNVHSNLIRPLIVSSEYHRFQSAVHCRIYILHYELCRFISPSECYCFIFWTFSNYTNYRVMLSAESV